MIPSDQAILYADDDESDAFLFRHAFEQAGMGQSLVVVSSGQAAIDYLSGKGAYADRERHPPPRLILLDLNMPGISGLEVLKWIRATPGVSTLPVIVLTSSNQEADIQHAYAQGANSYLVKPGDIDGIFTMTNAIKDYWLMQNSTSGLASKKWQS